MQLGRGFNVRVLLCEHDSALASVLLDLFAEEGIDVVRCDSFDELETRARAYSDAIVLTDSWVEGGLAQLTPAEREQLRTLGTLTTVIMTTGRDWAKHTAGSALGEHIVIMPKPFDIEELLTEIRAAGRRRLDA
jgi:DNA-binding response OmpR family regulator